jgi:hypothetical protein
MWIHGTITSGEVGIVSFEGEKRAESLKAKGRIRETKLPVSRQAGIRASDEYAPA